MAHQEHLTDTFIRDAYEAVAHGTAEPMDKLCIIIHEGNVRIMNRLNGHNRSKRSRAKSLALPTIGGTGIGGIFILELLKVAGTL